MNSAEDKNRSNDAPVSGAVKQIKKLCQFLENHFSTNEYIENVGNVSNRTRISHEEYMPPTQFHRNKTMNYEYCTQETPRYPLHLFSWSVKMLYH